MSYGRWIDAEILARWDQLLFSDLERVHTDRAELARLLEARYGFCRDRAAREADSFFAEWAERLRRATGT